MVPVFLFSVFFIMFQVNATITAPPITFTCPSASTTTMTVIMAPASMELAGAIGQHDVVLLPLLITWDTIMSVVGLATVLQQKPQFQVPCQAYTNYAIGSPQVRFPFFRVDPLTEFLMVVPVMVSLLSGFNVAALLTNEG